MIIALAAAAACGAMTPASQRSTIRRLGDRGIQPQQQGGAIGILGPVRE
jgi:hypothetical protein